jgi:hypothetical protein
MQECERLAFTLAIARRFQIVGGSVSAWHLGLSRRLDPEPVGVSQTVPVESWLLHYRGIDSFSKDGTSCFQPALAFENQLLRLEAGTCAWRGASSCAWKPVFCLEASG